MNVSIQDTYNLMWKLGAVVTNGADPMILETYETERRPVAEQLITLDTRLVQGYEKEEKDASSGVYEIREQYAGFMAGIDVSYPHSILVAEKDEAGGTNLAKNIKLGMRLPSFLVVHQCDGVPIHLAYRLPSDGTWRLLVFPGNLRKAERMKALSCFAETFSKCSHLAHLQQKQTQKRRCPLIESLLIQSSPRSAQPICQIFQSSSIHLMKSEAGTIGRYLPTIRMRHMKDMVLIEQARDVSFCVGLTSMWRGQAA